jgi:hypothetical protein
MATYGGTGLVLNRNAANGNIMFEKFGGEEKCR